MSETAVSNAGGLGREPAGGGDPELARIYELGQLMALPPRDLIARLKSDAEGPQDGDGWVHGDRATRPTSIPALADLASIVSTLERVPPVREPDRARWVTPTRPATRERAPVQDEEPIPALSTWRAQPVSTDEGRWFGRHVRAAALGLLAGLALIAAALVWLGGWLDGSHRHNAYSPAPVAIDRNVEPPAAAMSETAPPPPSTEEAPASPDAATGRTAPAETTVTPAKSAPSATPPSAQFLVQEATRRIAIGDVAGARELLTDGGRDPEGLVPYALAETYDPNMLAAWGLRGVIPDIAKAKELYGEALSLGNERARQRLEALQ